MTPETCRRSLRKPARGRAAEGTKEKAGSSKNTAQHDGIPRVLPKRAAHAPLQGCERKKAGPPAGRRELGVRVCPGRGPQTGRGKLGGSRVTSAAEEHSTSGNRHCFPGSGRPTEQHAPPWRGPPIAREGPSGGVPLSSPGPTCSPRAQNVPQRGFVEASRKRGQKNLTNVSLFFFIFLRTHAICYLGDWQR